VSIPSKRIAELSPEQRALFLQRLTRKAAEAAKGPASPPSDAAPPGDMTTAENFGLEVAQPGILDSVRVKSVPRRAPGVGEVEIDVHAGALNFRDVMIALGMYPTLPGKPAEMGSDCAGRVVALGTGVDDCHVGDEVIALANGFSGYTTTLAAAVAPKPARLTHEEAATIPTVFLTTYFALVHLARLSKGERILIHSAAGGVGLTAIQIAQWIGAEIIATAGTREKQEYVRALGVRHVFNSRSLEFVDSVLECTGRQGVDVVLNSLAGDAIPKGLTLLKPLGRFLELGKRDIYQNAAVGLLPFRKALSFHAVELGLVLRERPAFFRSMFREILAHFDAGVFKPLPTKVFRLSDIHEALGYMSEGTHIGKIAIRVKDGAAPVASR
jgi:NADPH:quinone reductase-like Zn-dependent oxidoreductase